ncbi:MAG: glycosyltransferase [Crocinitomicaceae bacterium]
MLISMERASIFAKCISKHELDLSTTVFYSYWCDDTALALALLNKKRGIKAISRMHRWDVYFNVHAINYLPFRHLIAQYVQLFAISKQGIQTAKEVWKVQQLVQLARLGTNPTFKIEQRTSKMFTIFSCSNVIPLKRVHLIAEALQHIQHIPIRWVHFGDGSELAQLKKQVQTLPPNIEVALRGRVANSEIYSAFATEQPHLFINVSSSEGVPVSIMEAMSFGVPVLATNVGGNSEIVNTQNGCLLHSNPSSTTIADEIKRFCSMTQETYNQYAENAYQTWKSEYNAEKNYTAFGEVLRGM